MALEKSEAFFYGREKMKNKFHFVIVTILLLVFTSCDSQRGLHPVQITGISGTITFVGDWPENTEWVRLLCFPEKPQSQEVTDILFSLFDSKIGDPIPENTTVHEFTSELDVKTYEWIVVVFNSSDFPFKVIGEYSEQDGIITIEKEKLVTNINITADFNTL